MVSSEPRTWATQRREAQRSQYPELELASPTDVARVDAYRIQRHQLPTRLTRDETQLAAAYARYRRDADITDALDDAPAPTRDTRTYSPDEFLAEFGAELLDYFKEVDRASMAGRVPSASTPSRLSDLIARAQVGESEAYALGIRHPDPFPMSAGERMMADLGAILGGGENLGNYLSNTFLEGVPGFEEDRNSGTRIREAIESIPVIGGVGGTAFDVGASPTTALSAGAFPALGRALPQTGRGMGTLRTLLGPATSGGVGSNFAAETGLGTAFSVGAEELTERGVPAPVALVGGLAAGGAGIAGVRGARAGIRAADEALTSQAIRQAEGPLEASTRGALRTVDGAVDPVIPGVTPRGRARVSGGALDIAEEVPTASSVFDAPPTVRQLYGTEPIAEGAQRGLGGRLAREGRFAADDPTATPAMLVRDESRRAVTNQATQVQERARALVNQSGFEFDKQGRIPSLANIDPDIPGAPTLRDVAARLPKYEPFLSDQQMASLDEIRAMLAPYRQALEEVAEAEARITGKPSTIQVGSRADVMEGGFYIPRGNAETEELAEIALRRGGRGPGRGKQGFEKSATFASEAEGIAAGYEYTPVADALGAYVRGIGNRTLDRHAANYFLSRVDEAGKPIAQSAADRIDPKLRGDVQSLRARIATRLQTLRGQTTRGRAQAAEAQRLGRTATRLDELTENAAQRAQGARARRTSTEVVDTADDIVTARTLVDDTDGVLKAAERELRILETQARQAGSRAEQAGARAAATEARRASTLAEIDQLRAQLDELNTRWQQAQRQAAATPRDRGRIQLPGLEGRDFPWEVADEANRFLQREQVANPGQVLRVVNGILRGVQATGEMSYLGIQGAVAMASGNRAWRRAAKVATRAWGSENALGDALRIFDERSAQMARPTVQEWAANGVRLAGGNTEFAVSGPQGAIRSVTRAARIPEAADRGFGAFGDTVRLELADILAEESLAAGRRLDAAEMKRIAQTVNRVSGFSQTRAAGDWGELLNFAPRYLAARIETLGQLASKDVRKRQLARRLIGRYVGIATILTIAANEAMGNETDFRPFSGSKGPTWNPLDAEYKNPNFLRVRALDRDWSFLGPVDATLGVVIGAGSLLSNPTGDPKEAVNRLRTVLSSPLASVGLDWLVFGENFEGESLDNAEALGRDLMHRIVPFAVPEMIESGFETADRAQSGDAVGAAREVAGGLTQAGLGFRGTPTTISEKVKEGRFTELKGRDQFRATSAQAWRELGENPDFSATVAKYDNAFQYRQRIVDEVVRDARARGLSPGQADVEAEAALSKNPVYREYLDLRNALRTWWVERNPAEAVALWNEEVKKPALERDWTPTKEQRQIMDAYLAGVAARESAAGPGTPSPSGALPTLEPVAP